MYAIAFDLDTAALQSNYPGNSSTNAYSAIASFLSERGFSRQQGSVYFGDNTVNAVRCVIAVQDLARRYSWFAPSVRDIRMLRIEEDNDLNPAIAIVASAVSSSNEMN
ncbi:MAG: virulence factor ['Candidatus Kapabacteria' thiocyanatum]|nr:virulence factor ['Candidatus Kapabacteria' thiocyanatum]